MNRHIAWFSVGLTAAVSFLVGMVVTGSMTPSPATSAPQVVTARPVRDDRVMVPGLAGVVNFADVAERLNPAVVNIDASSRPRRGSSGGGSNNGGRPGVDGRPPRPDAPDDPFEFRRRGETPKRGAGTGFIIDERGHILTNHHVIENAERIIVKLTDGRALRATVVGSDPDTDIALIRIVEGNGKFPHAELGNSDDLRVGEWVCAIGNPLAYEHTVTVGVVSFIGRKLFDTSLDNYIQTDAAINFGNSGGPLINSRGEVIGINSAISRQASSIGFAVPINQAKLILPQLMEKGRVSRGYIGVVLRDVDPDMKESLKLSRTAGALVQDVYSESPGERAGLKPYDLIVAVDGRDVPNNDALIREIAARQPGSTARLDLLRDNRPRQAIVKLAERDFGAAGDSRDGNGAGGTRTPRPSADRSQQTIGPSELGLTLIEINESNSRRFDVPSGMTGLLVQRVEPLSPAYDAGIERGSIILELNRQEVDTIARLRRLLEAAQPGQPLAVFIYIPDIDQRNIKTVRVDR
jgi:serine protease Do